MFLPLYDGEPLRYLHAPLITRALLGACTVAYPLTFFGPVAADWVIAGFGLIPAVLFGFAALPDGLPFVPAVMTLLTSVFLHGSLIHLGGNMLFLGIFGDNVEDAMGHGRFVIFFLACGAAAGLAHAIADPQAERPLIGASGAVAGVVAAYLILYPRVRVWALFLNRIPLLVPAYAAIGFWFLLQVLGGAFMLDDGVGWFAHLGGFAAGAVLVFPLRRRFDPLLARAQAQELRALR